MIGWKIPTQIARLRTESKKTLSWCRKKYVKDCRATTVNYPCKNAGYRSNTSELPIMLRT